MRASDLKLIAMYLPQFHVIPENSRWWGAGFTEWTNTKKARPLFKGHHQPKTPLGEDYYDLLDPKVLKRQALQAEKYGIYGFSFYHYWFERGKKLLYRPAEILLEHKDIQLNFCFTWANEDWTRTWHAGGAGNKEILMREAYGGTEDWEEHFKYLISFFQDKRYMKVDNRPVFLIYNLRNLMDSAPGMLACWNALARENGFDGIYWIAFDSQRTSASHNYISGIEEICATADFVPGRVRNEIRDAADWKRTCKTVIRHLLPEGIQLPEYFYDLIRYDDYHKRILNEEHGEKQFRNCLVDYDDSPRRGRNAIIFDGTSPEKFGKYLQEYIKKSVNENKEFLFLTAWNEWGEGNHIEPDETFGYQWLEAVQSAKKGLESDGMMLSIVVTTYGHEIFIREALDSILMQKTTFRYEVLVGEDASPDSTKDILQEYEKKHPEIFTMFYREKNMGTHDNGWDLSLRCKGKYVICLEGDDFWIDTDKLEKQIQFLEAHPEYIAVAHNCLVVDEQSRPSGEKYPECREKEYSLVHYANGILPGQTATVMYRNIYKDQLLDTGLLGMDLMPGDRLLYFTLICNGRIFCMQESKSAYRHVTESGFSYSAMNKDSAYDYTQTEKWYGALVTYADRIGHKEGLRVAQMLYVTNMMSGLRRKQLPIKQVYAELKKINIKCGRFFLYVIRFLNFYVFGKQLWK